MNTLYLCNYIDRCSKNSVTTESLQKEAQALDFDYRNATIDTSKGNNGYSTDIPNFAFYKDEPPNLFKARLKKAVQEHMNAQPVSYGGPRMSYLGIPGVIGNQLAHSAANAGLGLGQAATWLVGQRSNTDDFWRNAQAAVDDAYDTGYYGRRAKALREESPAFNLAAAGARELTGGLAAAGIGSGVSAGARAGARAVSNSVRAVAASPKVAPIVTAVANGGKVVGATAKNIGNLAARGTEATGHVIAKVPPVAKATQAVGSVVSPIVRGGKTVSNAVKPLTSWAAQTANSMRNAVNAVEMPFGVGTLGSLSTPAKLGIGAGIAAQFPDTSARLGIGDPNVAWHDAIERTKAFGLPDNYNTQQAEGGGYSVYTPEGGTLMRQTTDGESKPITFDDPYTAATAYRAMDTAVENYRSRNDGPFASSGIGQLLGNQRTDMFAPSVIYDPETGKPELLPNPLPTKSDMYQRAGLGSAVGPIINTASWLIPSLGSKALVADVLDNVTSGQPLSGGLEAAAWGPVARKFGTVPAVAVPSLAYRGAEAGLGRLAQSHPGLAATLQNVGMPGDPAGAIDAGTAQDLRSRYYGLFGPDGIMESNVDDIISEYEKWLTPKQKQNAKNPEYSVTSRLNYLNDIITGRGWDNYNSYDDVYRNFRNVAPIGTEWTWPQNDSGY